MYSNLPRNPRTPSFSHIPNIMGICSVEDFSSRGDDGIMVISSDSLKGPPGYDLSVGSFYYKKKPNGIDEIKWLNI